LGDESLDGLPVSLMHRIELWGGPYLEMEIRNGRLRFEKHQKTSSL
jgi:hypothetical protein